MASQRTGIAHVEYVIGDVTLDVDELPNKSDVLAAHGMPDVKEVWGWQHCRRSDLRPVALASDAATRTLAHGIDPAAIGALIVCCGERLNYYDQNRFLAELAGTLKLGDFRSYWLGGAGCVTLFSALGLARAMLTADAVRHVLVVSVDKVADDADRFQRFGVLSDAACSFVVSDAVHTDFSIIDAVTISSARTLERSEDFQAKCALIHSALERFGQPQGFDYDRVEAFFGANVFLPIQELELSLLPIDSSLAYLDNTARYGHCYAADPIINLVDFYRDSANSGVRTTLMASTAHGHFGVVGLEKN